MYTIVEARHVHHLCHAAAEGTLSLVHALRDGTGGVERVDETLQADAELATHLAALLGNLVADGPHDDGGVVAVGYDEVGDVPISPLVEEAGVAVLALRIAPHVERLGHDHHAQRVADIHLHLARHVVSRADGIAAHVLQDLDLADERGLVDGGTEGAEVMVQTDSAQLARLAVQLEAFLL